jgi:hypothetical protein
MCLKHDVMMMMIMMQIQQSGNDVIKLILYLSQKISIPSPKSHFWATDGGGGGCSETGSVVGTFPFPFPFCIYQSQNIRYPTMDYYN